MLLPSTKNIFTFLLFKYLRLEHVAYKTLMSKTPIQLKIMNQIKN